MGTITSRLPNKGLFQDVSITLNLLAGDTPSTVGLALIALKAKNTIFVQRIAVHVRTAAAQALTFQDNNGTPKVIAVLPASATAGDLHVLLDDDDGVPLTEGKQLDLTGVAGVAATIMITAYRQPTSTRSMSEV
jgi:hypothetical protein